MVSIAVCDDDREYINDVERHISQYFAENGLSYSLFTTQNGNELVESDSACCALKYRLKAAFFIHRFYLPLCF